LLVERCQLVGNRAESLDGHSFPRGGALSVSLGGNATARVVDSRFATNEARSTVSGQQATAGAIEAAFLDDAVLEIHRVELEGNVVTPGPGGLSSAAGAFLLGFGAALATVSDTTWSGHDLQGSGVSASALVVNSFGTGTRIVERARFVGNDVGQFVPQLTLDATGQSTLIASSLLVADGANTGIRARAAETSTVLIGHATVTGALTGALLETTEDGIVRVESSLFWDNDTDVLDTVPSSIDPSTMTGVDPLFVAPASGDYTLGPGSPAVDFGDRTLPSVGPWDARHAPRVVGVQTDAGAFERGGLFGDGFESGDAAWWSATAPW
jgi:hypothetical protein